MISSDEINRLSLIYSRAAHDGDSIDVDAGGKVILVAKGQFL